MKEFIKEGYMYLLGAIIVVGFFLLLYLLVYQQIPIENKDILNIVVGALIGSFTTVVGYFYGSSKSSADKTELLKKYFNDIIVIADNDDAGNSMAKRLQEKLGAKVSVLHLETKYKDIGDMDDVDIKALSFDFADSISSILN